MNWLKGLLAALAGGAVAGVAQAGAQALSTGHVKGTEIGVAALGGAGLTVSAYLTQSPIKSDPPPPKV